MPPGSGAKSEEEEKEMQSIIQKMDLKSEEQIKQEKQAEAFKAKSSEQKTEDSSADSESKNETNLSEPVQTEQKESERNTTSGINSRCYIFLI